MLNRVFLIRLDLPATYLDKYPTFLSEIFDLSCPVIGFCVCVRWSPLCGLLIFLVTLKHSNLAEMLMSPDMKEVMMTEKDNWEVLPWGRNSLCLGEKKGLTTLSQMTFLFERQCLECALPETTRLLQKYLPQHASTCFL